LARKESQEDILIRNAVANLDASNPVNVILADIINNDLYHPSSMDSEENYDFDLYELFNEDNIDETVTTTDSDLDKTSGISSNFDYNNFSHPDYLSTVAGQTITMPNGEVRTYSSDGTSYSIPAEPWMGIEGAGSTYQITTHNKLSGAAYSEPDKQYIGISGDIGIPLALGAVTWPLSWTGSLGVQAGYQALSDPKGTYGGLSGVLGWLYNKATSAYKNNSEQKNNQSPGGGGSSSGGKAQ
jgi:hypothetical protein